MGIYNRDYYRGPQSGEQIPPVCKGLIIATVGVFLLQIFITRPTTPQDLRAIIERDERATPARKKPDKKPLGNNELHRSDKDNAEKDTPRRSRRRTGRMGRILLPMPSRPVKHCQVKTTRSAMTSRPSLTRRSTSKCADAAELMPSVSIVQEWFELDPHKVVRQGQIWRLLTCAFCHDRFGVWHIVMNMLFFYWFGKMLEPLYGSREFLIFYLTAAVVSSLCFVGLALYTHDPTPAIGASGAVMAVIVLYAIHHPREKIYVFMMIPIEIRWLVLIYIVYDLHPVLLALAGTPMYTGIANAAHLGGAALASSTGGAGCGWKTFGTASPAAADSCGFGSRATCVSTARRKRNESNADALDALVDEILAKIHKHGESSLTERERRVLRTAADRYKGQAES